jgi:hypothetical protein
MAGSRRRRAGENLLAVAVTSIIDRRLCVVKRLERAGRAPGGFSSVGRGPGLPQPTTAGDDFDSDGPPAPSGHIVPRPWRGLTNLAKGAIPVTVSIPVGNDLHLSAGEARRDRGLLGPFH